MEMYIAYNKKKNVLVFANIFYTVGYEFIHSNTSETKFSCMMLYSGLNLS